MNHRYTVLPIMLAVIVAAPAVPSQQPAAAQAVGGCAAEPLAFHTCALTKAKTFNPPRTPSGKPNLQGYYRARPRRHFRLRASRDPNRSSTAL